MSSEAIHKRSEMPVVRSSGRTRRLLATIISMSVVAMLALIALVWFSDFPGTPQGSTDKSEAPPEDVRGAP
jgi:hypothetical protein